MKSIDELFRDPALLRRVQEFAVDAAWSAIESASIRELEGDIEWMDFSDDFDDCEDEVSLLADLGLLGTHPEHPTWVREVASL